uniref:Uncharacterized protein LOC110192433 n=1 Tax=Phascolarctos cinereus TaxID=38626 RepID=A0A6P5IDI3_PHACI|nr:uncharacterized protein LOC110192433 [Phascolarctos cinereus]
MAEMRIMRKIANVLQKINSPIHEVPETRTGSPDSPAESSATARSLRPHLFVPQGDTWSPECIRVLLDVWASPDIQAMRGARKRRRVIYRSIANRLNKEGVKRTWVQCRDMMQALEDLYYYIQEANQRRPGGPIPCPFHEGLEKVLPFSQAWHEVPDAEPIGYEPSGAPSLNPMPVWTPPWLGQLLPEVITWNGPIIDEGETSGTAMNSLQEPPQLISRTPHTFIYVINQMDNWNIPQRTPEQIPWAPSPLIFMSNNFTQEPFFQYPTQIIPFQSIQVPSFLHQRTIENNPHFEPQDSPSGSDGFDLMEDEEAGQCISPERPQGILSRDTPLINTDKEEPVGNSSQDPTELTPQTVPTLHSTHKEERVDTTPQGHAPQEISYTPISCIQNPRTYEYHPPNPCLMSPSPFPYPHEPPQFFPPSLYFFPHMHIQMQ